ncbi:putative membrane protein [Neorickettsia sennetsu str. Miyayama]|uniref:Membrane protein n=2 Tax=Ehrlichia sennetsu TaxID=951 RepID=Q2GES5_EHRS3|nr:putative membrane protein [Neorickettsia sennetsu str. Miyayama]
MSLFTSVMKQRWLSLGVLALGLSGIFSLFVVLLRLPFFIGLVPNIFDVSLVIHVTLGINAWMLAITAATIAGEGYFQKFSHNLCLLGVIFIFIAGFIPETHALKNNYIPFLNNLPYVLGTALLSFGLSVSAINTLCNRTAGECKRITALIFLISQLCTYLAYARMPSGITLYDFYEYLFWGGGHILQFVFCQTLMLVYATLLGIGTSDRTLRGLSLFNLLAVLPTPVLYFFFSPDREILIRVFTYHMRVLGSVAPMIFIFYLLSLPKKRVDWSNIAAFTFSACLFIYGGLLGFLIRESNVVIPAHYHGSIIGITLAFMAFAYHFTGILSLKLPMLQLTTYSIGQFAHITGLLLMGGYGALRKSAGMVGGSTTLFKSIFFFGGSLSILSGGLFVILLTSTLLKNEKGNETLKSRNSL